MTADVPRIAEEASASISAVCRVLNVPRSSTYERANRGPTRRALRYRALDGEIRTIFAEHRGRCGSPRVTRLLSRKNSAGRKLVAKRMRAMGLRAGRRRRFVATSKSDRTHKHAENVLDRQFTWPSPNQAWVGDITFVATRCGWAYLAILVDLCTRAIVGWAVSRNCDELLARRALENAVVRHRPPRGLIHHTDRGSTYTATNYQKRVNDLGMTPSMSRRGNCWDNAVAESTIGTIKAECLDGMQLEDAHDVTVALLHYIDGYYNRIRLHSSVGYMSPAQYQPPGISEHATTT